MILNFTAEEIRRLMERPYPSVTYLHKELCQFWSALLPASLEKGANVKLRQTSVLRSRVLNCGDTGNFIRGRCWKIKDLALSTG